MARLISDYNKKQINSFSVLREAIPGQSEKRLFVKCPFQVFDEENQNGRIYPREILMPEIDRYKKEYVDTGRAFGELDHPEGPEINGDRICHRVVDLWVEGNVVWGKSLILNTSKGKEVQAMLEDGGVMGVSSRALGELDGQSKVYDMHLICWDVVQEPSVSIALMEKINESKVYDMQKFIETEKKLYDCTKKINRDDERKMLAELKRLLAKNL